LCYSRITKKKVIDKLKKPFVLIVDEAHEKFSNLDFRPKFKDIDVVEEKAKYIVYVTSTPAILYQTEHFNFIIKVKKHDQIKQKVKIIETDRSTINLNQKYLLLKEFLNKYPNTTIIFYNNNIPQNIKLGRIFAKDNQKILELNRNSSLLYNKREDLKKLLETGDLEQDINIFFTTSCIQAGININNGDILIIYVCNEHRDFRNEIFLNDFNLVNFLQFIGRFRNKEKVKEIILLKPKLHRANLETSNLKEIYNDKKKIKNVNIKLFQQLLFKFEENLLRFLSPRETIKFISNESNQRMFEDIYKYVDQYTSEFYIYQEYCQLLIRNEELLIIELENDEMINLEVELPVQRYEIDTENKNKCLKITKVSENPWIIIEILKLSDNNIRFIIENKFSETKIDELIYNEKLEERKEFYKLIKQYNVEINISFKRKIENIAQNLSIDKVLAFKILALYKQSEINDIILKYRINELNNEIKKVSIDKFIENIFINKELTNRILSKDLKITILIRYILKDVEKKQGRISKEQKNIIVDSIIKYGIEERKARNAIEKKINKLISMIYNLSDDISYPRISSVNHKEQEKLENELLKDIHIRCKNMLNI